MIILQRATVGFVLHRAVELSWDDSDAPTVFALHLIPLGLVLLGLNFLLKYGGFFK
jgi:hypothetical protein